MTPDEGCTHKPMRTTPGGSRVRPGKASEVGLGEGFDTQRERERERERKRARKRE
jgi:hypothetical protein